MVIKIFCCCYFLSHTQKSFNENVFFLFFYFAGPNENRTRIFSPRMDYDEWTPLGRGDPLKNDPTYDYVPPVLDRVQYWLDTHTTEPSSKRDILVLGVTAKKTSPKIPEHYLQFVDGLKYSRNQESSYMSDFTGSSGAEPPKIVRAPSFRNGGGLDYRNRLQPIPNNYYSYYPKQKPYTMMLPPPIFQKGGKDTVFGEQTFNTQTEEGPLMQEPSFFDIPSKSYSNTPLRPIHPPPSKISSGPVVSQIETIKSVYSSSSQPPNQRFEGTTPSVSFEKSNLIYQSTQTLEGDWLAQQMPTIFSSSVSPTPSDQQVWQTSTRDHLSEADHQPAASSNHEIVVNHNANTVVDKNEIQAGQKDTTTTTTTTLSTTTQVPVTQESSKPTESTTVITSPSTGATRMHIIMANSPSTVDQDNTQRPVEVVIPTNYMDKNATEATTQDAKSTVPIASTSTTTATTTSTTSRSLLNLLENTINLSEIERPIESQKPPIARPSTSVSYPPFEEQTQRQIAANKIHGFHRHQPPQRQSTTFASSMPAMQSLRPTMMHFIRSGMPFRPPPSSLMGHMHPPPPMSLHHGPPPKMSSAMGIPSPNMLEHTRFPTPAQQQPQNFPGPLTMPSTRVEDPRRPPEIYVTTLQPLTAPTTASSSSEIPLAVTVDAQEAKRNSLLKILKEEVTRKKLTSQQPQQPTTTATPTTTTLRTEATSSATTTPTRASANKPLIMDPVLAQYMQPARQVRVPMYLIIQGHSKVKTYKPSVNRHGIPVESVNEVPAIARERHHQVSKLERLINEKTRSATSVGERKKAEEKPITRETRIGQQQESLLSLVESGLAAFTVQPSAAATATEEERQINSVTSVDI